MGEGNAGGITKPGGAYVSYGGRAEGGVGGELCEEEIHHKAAWRSSVEEPQSLLPSVKRRESAPRGW
ncbi:UNVERIFIED_CONTAM: hypothetical protein Sangu_1535700 [Sesamum angustifolium]|uniref:Uncharacterized protein n=1 Tax=Sesamum angustifolium TaxID=2727405 RepID=A0AAW2MQ85_9LAMI